MKYAPYFPWIIYIFSFLLYWLILFLSPFEPFFFAQIYTGMEGFPGSLPYCRLLSFKFNDTKPQAPCFFLPLYLSRDISLPWKWCQGTSLCLLGFHAPFYYGCSMTYVNHDAACFSRVTSKPGEGDSQCPLCAYCSFYYF